MGKRSGASGQDFTIQKEKTLSAKGPVGKFSEDLLKKLFLSVMPLKAIVYF